jgi:hypothetical protein
MTSIRCAPKALLQGAAEAQRAPGGIGEGLRQLDVQIDVTAARFVVHSEAEHPDVGVRPETLGTLRNPSIKTEGGNVVQAPPVH